MRIRILISMLVGLASLHGESPVGEDAGTRFKVAFVAAIQDAKTIRATEHSFTGDLSGNEKSPEVIYKALELSPEMKKELLAAAQKMEVSPLAEGKRCFAPHHSLEFTDAGGKKRVIGICFGCLRTTWDSESSGRAPGEFFQVMKKFLEAKGFQADRDWGALAAAKKTGDSGAKKQE